MAFYAQTSGIQSTNSGSFVPIPGLSLTIPEGVGTTAIIILNVPFPFSEGNNNPGGSFGITVNGVLSSVIAGFTYSEQVPPSSGTRPNDAGRRRSPRHPASDHTGRMVRCPRQHGDHRYARNTNRDHGLAPGVQAAGRQADLGELRGILS